MKRLLLKSFLSLFLIGTASVNAQCPVTSTPGNECTYGDQIDLFKINNIASTGSLGCSPNGYASFNSPIWTLTQGQTYNWYAEVGYDNGVPFYPEAIAIWIDLNNDGFYGDDELVVNSPASPTHSGTLTIPLSTLPANNISMRVRCAYEAEGVTPWTASMACNADFTYGETEDYKINVVCPNLVAPTATASQNVCNNQASSISASTGLGVITWYSQASGGTSIGTGSPFSVGSPTTNATYYAASETPGCASSRTTINTEVRAVPTVDVGNTLSNCGPGLTIDAGNAGSSFLWNNGATTQTTIADTSGNYAVVVTNSFGCTGTDNVSVTINPVPTINPIDDRNLCSSASVDVIVVPNISGGTYVWNPAVVSGGSVTLSPSSTTTYSVVYSVNGCNSQPESFTVTVLPSPNVNLGNDITDAQGSVTLNAGSGFTSYLWSNGATTSSITVTSTDEYTVTVTAANGCTATSSVNVGFTGIDENSIINFNIHPNPFNSSIVLSSSEIGSEFSLNDISGKSILKGKITSTEQELQLENLPKGIYLIQVNGTSQRIIKQ